MSVRLALCFVIKSKNSFPHFILQKTSILSFSICIKEKITYLDLCFVEMLPEKLNIFFKSLQEGAVNISRVLTNIKSYLCYLFH